jgi:hypothetical protein
MSQECELLEPDEFVFRRIHKNHVSPGTPPIVGFAAFRPTTEDTAGLSVYEEKLISAAAVAAAGRKPGEYYVARLLVSDLHQLGLTVRKDEQPNGPVGHALIPELSLDACRIDKARWRAIQVLLAEIAGKGIVVFPQN